MSSRSLCAVLGVALLGLPASPSFSAPAPDSFAPLAAKLKPSVVNISTTTVVKHGQDQLGKPPGFGPRDPFHEPFGDDFFRRFFGDQPREFKTQSLGSGCIIDKSGLIFTNDHVVDGADEIVVKLSDEHEFKAKVIGVDHKTDIALIRIDPTGVELQPADLGDSETVQVGDWVLAIGNPFGYDQTVTAGIISAKERVIGSGPYDSFLQTDAAINPGNSGGPLFDMKGRVIGINTAIVAGGTGIGFAIPVNMAKEVLAQLEKEGKVTRGWLGIQFQPMTADLAKSFGLTEPKGALVADVLRDGPAERAGIRRKDIIMAFGGTPIDKAAQLPHLVARRAPGSQVEVTVLRDGKKETIPVKLGEMPREGGAGSDTEDSGELGLTAQEITPEIARHLELDVEAGLVISGVEPGTPAAEAGLRRGDVILEVNQNAVGDLRSYRKALKDSAGKESALFLVKRGEGTLFVVVRLPK